MPRKTFTELEKMGSGHFRRIITDFKTFVADRAGGDLNGLLSYVMDKTKEGKLFRDTRQLSADKLETLISSIISAREKMEENHDERRQLLSFLAPHFRLSELQKYGPVSESCFTSAQKHAKKFHGGHQQCHLLRISVTSRCQKKK